MIIDWTNPLKTLQSDSSQESRAFETIVNDLRRIMDGAFAMDLVIIRFREGFRAEVRFLDEFGIPEIKSVVKDFNRIREYDLQIEKMGELRDQVAELLQEDYPEQFAKIDQQFNENMKQPLFELNFILDNKVIKSLTRVHYPVVHMTLLGMVAAFYQDRETV